MENRLEETVAVIREAFFKYESISVAIGLSKQPEAIRELDDLVVDAAIDGVSILVEEKATGKIVGCLINKIHEKKRESEDFFTKFHCKHPSTQAFLEVNAALDKKVNSFDPLQTDCYLETMFTAILPEFRRRGIARRLQEVTGEIVQHLVNGQNVKVPITGKYLPLHPIPTAVLGFPTTTAMEKVCSNLGYLTPMKIDLRECGIKSDKMPASTLSKVPPIAVMYKQFKKSV